MTNEERRDKISDLLRTKWDLQTQYAKVRAEVREKWPSCPPPKETSRYAQIRHKLNRIDKAIASL